MLTFRHYMMMDILLPSCKLCESRLRVIARGPNIVYGRQSRVSRANHRFLVLPRVETRGEPEC